MNSRRTLQEITQRVEDAINQYEKVEDPDRFKGIRRPTEVESTFAELAEAGRARVDVYTVALVEISTERQTVLRDLKNLLDEQRSNAESTQQEDRKALAEKLEQESGADEAMDEAQLIERLDLLESLQRKLGNTGTSILSHLKADTSGQLIKQLRVENTQLRTELDAANEKCMFLINDVSEAKTKLASRDVEIRELREEIAALKEKLQMANARTKEAKASASAEAKAAAAANANAAAASASAASASAAAATSAARAGTPSASSRASSAEARSGGGDSDGALATAHSTIATLEDEVSRLTAALHAGGVELPPPPAVEDTQRYAMMAAQAEDAAAELAQMRAQLSEAGGERERLEAELRDATEAVQSAGGGAVDLMEAKKEISRLTREAEASQALQAAERERLIDEAKELGRREAASQLGPSAPAAPPPKQRGSGRRGSRSTVTIVEPDGDEPPASSPPAVDIPVGRNGSAEPSPRSRGGQRGSSGMDSMPEDEVVASQEESGSFTKRTAAHQATAAAAGGGAPAARSVQRRGSLRGAGGLESETERAQAGLFEARKELQAEHEELARVRESLRMGRENLHEMRRMAAEGGGGMDAAAAARMAEMDASISALDEVSTPVGVSKQELEAAMMARDEEGTRQLELMKEALGDEHTIAIEDAEELRIVCCQVLAIELREAEDAAVAGTATSANEEDRKAMMAARAEDAAAELAQMRAQLSEAGGEKERLEAELRDATEAVQSAGGGAVDLMEAKKEISRLKRSAAGAEASQALQAAERERLIDEAKELGRREGEAAMEEGARARTAELDQRVLSDAAIFNALHPEIANADARARVAESGLADARERAAAAVDWAHGRVLAVEASYEARLATALAAQESALDDMAAAKREALAARRSVEEMREGGVFDLGPALGASVRGSASMGAEEGTRADAAQNAADEPPAPAAGVTSVGGRVLDSEVEACETGQSSRLSSAKSRLTGSESAAEAGGAGVGGVSAMPAAAERDADDEDGGMGAIHGGIAAMMSQDAANALLERTQKQLLEVAALTDFEHQMLLGETPANPATPTGMSSPRVELAMSASGDKPASNGLGGARSNAKVIAGPPSRIAWLLREGLGHTQPMGIWGAVKPAVRPMDHAQLRTALRSLFAQQRTLASQSAIGNWELLGAMAMLRPKQLHLQRVHDHLVAEIKTTQNEERRTALSTQLPKVAGLSTTREEQRRWCCQVWELRRQAVGAVSSRLLSQTLYALTKLTDAVNVQPAGNSLTPSAMVNHPPSPRAKKHEALAAAIFSAPPLLPFVQPPYAAARGMARPAPDDWAEWTGASAGVAPTHDLWGKGNGLTSEQMQRLCVAAQHWPKDFANLGGRLQRQVLAEAVAYCVTGSAIAGTPPAERPQTAPIEPHRPTTAPPAPGTPGLPPPGTHKAAAEMARARAFEAGVTPGQPVVLRQRRAAESPRAMGATR